ncbi:GNAT family N-acetyltransferase [Actinoplanes rectilineatus]|uniref:GNAT family N-acetyltransferase n=1 Tax=Actinoplanes rectilineatus TaxID=113571 RepID=UPI0005F2942E|nr:GNAT family N-acetyltransferase [Actinoplanes rectilineatus]
MTDSAEWTDVRPGRPADLPAVLALLDDAVGWLTSHGRSGQWGTSPLSASPRVRALISRVAACGGLHLAVQHTRVVGALGFGSPPTYADPAREPELYIMLLVTDRELAGQGIGARLLAHAQATAARAGRALLRVDCYAGGDGALVRYYESQGFVPTQRFAMAQPSGDPWRGQVLSRRIPLGKG